MKNKRNYGKETKLSLGTVINNAEVKLRRRRMSAAINCCSYLSLQTSLAELNMYLKQSGHEVNRDRQPVPSTKNGISEGILLDIQSLNTTQKKILSTRRAAQDYDY